MVLENVEDSPPWGRVTTIRAMRGNRPQVTQERQILIAGAFETDLQERDLPNSATGMVVDIWGLFSCGCYWGGPWEVEAMDGTFSGIK
jgi:hypothetical protein